MPSRLLILYAYYDTEDAQRNLSFFCRHGITPDRNRDYVIVVNGDTCKVEKQIPKFENVRVLKRHNKGFDFGAWAHALRHVAVDQFDFFFFLNSSVTGPFVPLYQDGTDWPSTFLAMLSDTVKLAGITINVWQGDPIVQSMFLATDRTGLKVLLANGMFTNNDADATKLDVILKREIASSQIITKSGFLVDSLDIIHHQRSLPVLKRIGAGDIFQPRAYPDGYTLEPSDVCFFKTNRGCSPEALDRAIRLADHKRSNAAQRCLQDKKLQGTFNALRNVPSAWTSHIDFAAWLTCRFLPQVIVDLGVDYGCSTYTWGATGVASVIGVDWFRGDEQTGFRDTRSAVAALGDRLMRDYTYPDTVRICAASFDDAAKMIDREIDLLHLDGLHTYDAMKADLKKWLPKLARDGIVVIHGISVLPDVNKAFERLSQPKLRIDQSTGLGICADQHKLEIIDREWKQGLGR